jgi:hypothetical protein
MRDFRPKPPLLLSMLALALFAAAQPALAQDEEAPWPVRRVTVDLAQAELDDAFWSGVPALTVTLMAQPMVRPRPAETTTPQLAVQAVHDGTLLALRFVWADPERSEAGRLGEYSDGAAVMFPLRAAEFPPPILMGTKQAPVHIFHWRAQYQRDADRGKPTMRELYPNLSIDMYPLEYADSGSVNPSVTAREQYSPGLAVGNPQSFPKSGVDEVYAEGFSTSSVQESAAAGHGEWRDGRWTLVVVRPLALEGGSTFAPGDRTFAAFAIWQGGRDEVGARKSVTMTWAPLQLEVASAPAIAATGEGR